MNSAWHANKNISTRRLCLAWAHTPNDSNIIDREGNIAMKLFDIDGKKTAILNMFIDPENGFLKLGLTDEDGGVLYVPGGEEVAPVMGGIIEKSRGSIFI